MKFLLSQLKQIEPTPPIATFADKYAPRSVLDIGTGTGRNAIFLAGRGFTVTATDKDAESADEIQTFAKKERLPLVVHVADLKTDTPAFSEFRAILFSFVLHYLKRGRAETLLRQAMDTANQQDVHVISAVTTDGDFFQQNPDSYYPQPGMLADMYRSAGWKIVEYTETESPMRAKRSDGTHMRNTISHLIAEKE